MCKRYILEKKKKINLFVFYSLQLVLILFHYMLYLGKRDLVSCDAIAPAIKGNMWNLDEIMLAKYLPLRKQEGLLCSSITRSRRREKYCIVTKAMSSTEEHLSSLSSYLEKLHNFAKQPSSRISKERRESIDKIDELKADNGLRSLDNYLVKVKGGNRLDHNKGPCSLLITWSCRYSYSIANSFPPSYLAVADAEPQFSVNIDIKASVDTSTKKDHGTGGEKWLKNYIELKRDNAEGKETSSNEASDLYLM